MIVLLYLAFVNFLYYGKAAVMKDSMFFISHHIARMAALGSIYWEEKPYYKRQKLHCFLVGLESRFFSVIMTKALSG